MDARPRGNAFTWALKEFNEEWSDREDPLVRLSSTKSSSGVAPAQTAGQSQGKGTRPRSRSRSARARGSGGKGKGDGQRPRWTPLGDYRRAATMGATKEGKAFCRAYLVGRCSTSIRCPKGDAHGCNLVLVKTGKVCGQLHEPARHKEAVHGYLKAA